MSEATIMKVVEDLMARDEVRVQEEWEHLMSELRAKSPDHPLFKNQVAIDLMHKVFECGYAAGAKNSAKLLMEGVEKLTPVLS